MRNKHFALFLLMGAALLLLFSACSMPGSGIPQSNLTVKQVLQNSQKAMSQLKSTHIDLQIKGSGQASSATATQPTGTPTTTGAVKFSLTGSGDEALPGQEQMNVTVTQSVTNTANSFAEILSGGKFYVQFAGQWYELNNAENGVSNPLSWFSSPDMTQLLGLLDHMQIVDHGDESLNGTILRHITFNLDKVALQQLLSSNQQLVNLVGQQNINALLNNTQTFVASLDLWIDETQFYVHRTEIKLNLSINPAALTQTVTPTANSPIQGLIPSNVLANLDFIVDLSKFNQPVSITPPANATPVGLPTTTP